ncbi:MAG TPA: hypothetical protein VIL00_05445 [Pseudonocardiaceae bacterium]
MRAKSISGPVLRRWLPLVASVVILLAVLAGLGLRQLYQADRASGDDRTTTPSTTGQQAERPVVTTVTSTSDAQAHPDHPAVSELVRRHFEAINKHDYQQWRKTVVAQRAQALSQAKWQEDMRSTHDSDIVLHRIEAGPDKSLRILLTFTSNQDPEDAPTEAPVSCLRWRVVYLVTVEDGELRLDISPRANSLFEPCP